jgi:hypothetical protein
MKTLCINTLPPNDNIVSCNCRCPKLPRKIYLILFTILFSWIWFATEPEKVVGKLEVKVGPEWSTVYRTSILGHTLDIGYYTYKLCLVDVYEQHIDVDVSKKDFDNAKFGETNAWNVCRIRKHYWLDYWRNK